MSSPSPSLPTAARFLERALLFTWFAHFAALFGMILLLPGLPGGSNDTVAARAAYLAEHPWLWRLGWLPWQITALSDLLIALALVATPWVPRWPAVLTLVVTLAALVPDQSGEFLWITQGVELASEAARTGDVSPFELFETGIYARVALWAATLYTCMAAGWVWCFAAAGTWNRLLSVFSAVILTVFLLASAGPLVLPPKTLPAEVVGAANGVGFLTLLVWLTLVTEQVLRRSRGDAGHGRQVPWRYPRRGWWGYVLGPVANSRFARVVGELLPTPPFVSDITDVMYVNYLVEADRLKPLTPEGLELQRLGPDGRYALFTFLSYRHGHFGPRLFGPLRKLLPSPVQSNWRIHVRDPQTGHQGIYFVSTAIDRAPHALAARLLSEGLPMHLLERGDVTASADGRLTLLLAPGQGSGPDAVAELRPVSELPWKGVWRESFGSYREFLKYAVPQDRALSSQPWYNRVTRQEIQLGIPVEACKPLMGAVQSRAAAIVGAAEPVCFHVANVFFRFEREVYDWRVDRNRL